MKYREDLLMSDSVRNHEKSRRKPAADDAYLRPYYVVTVPEKGAQYAIYAPGKIGKTAFYALSDTVIGLAFTEREAIAIAVKEILGKTIPAGKEG